MKVDAIYESYIRCSDTMNILDQKADLILEILRRAEVDPIIISRTEEELNGILSIQERQAFKAGFSEAVSLFFDALRSKPERG